MRRFSPLLALTGSAFCAWQARELFNAWRHAPFDRFDPLAFAVWALPIAAAAARRAAFRFNPTLLLAAAAATLLGSLLDLNVLQNAALALALGSFVVSRPPFVPWLLAAPAWWPVFGYAISGWGAVAVAVARLAVAGAAAAWGWWLTTRTDGSPRLA